MLADAAWHKSHQLYHGFLDDLLRDFTSAMCVAIDRQWPDHTNHIAQLECAREARLAATTFFQHSALHRPPSSQPLSGFCPRRHHHMGRGCSAVGVYDNLTVCQPCIPANDEFAVGSTYHSVLSRSPPSGSTSRMQGSTTAHLHWSCSHRGAVRQHDRGDVHRPASI